MARRDGAGSVLDMPATGDVDADSIGATNGHVDDNEDSDDNEGQTTEGTATDTGTGKRAKREPVDFTKLGPNEMVSLNVRVPNGLRSKLEEDSTKQEISIPQYVTRMLADAYEYTLPEVAKKSRKKYTTDEERKAAQKASQEKSRTTTKALLDAAQSGKLGIDIEALVRDYVAKQAAEEATKAASGEGTSEDNAPTDGQLVASGASS